MSACLVREAARVCVGLCIACECARAGCGHWQSRALMRARARVRVRVRVRVHPIFAAPSLPFHGVNAGVHRPSAFGGAVPTGGDDGGGVEGTNVGGCRRGTDRFRA